MTAAVHHRAYDFIRRNKMASAFGVSLTVTIAMLAHIRLTAASPTGINADGSTAPTTSLSITFPDLGRPFSTFEPAISAETVTFHYTKHQAGYVARLNDILSKTNGWVESNIEQVRTDLAMGLSLVTSITVRAPQPSVLFNMAAQIYNHALYFHLLQAPRVVTSFPPQEHALSKLIIDKYGSYAGLMQQLKQAALSHFGSGWAWVVANASQPGAEISIEVISTHDAEVPLKLTATGGAMVWPLLVCDVWEHAYYVDYRNDRAAYFANWTAVVDWSKVVARFESRGAERSRDVREGTGRTYPLF
jgi:Fe-Mn family superoxide dismutase